MFILSLNNDSDQGVELNILSLLSRGVLLQLPSGPDDLGSSKFVSSSSVLFNFIEAEDCVFLVSMFHRLLDDLSYGHCMFYVFF